MAAGKYNILVQQGADYIQLITVKESTTNVAVDLTGVTVRGMIRVNYDDPTPIATFTMENTDLPNGQFTMKLSNTVTAALTFETAYYDVEIVYPNTVVDRILQGKVVLSKEATK